MSRYILLVCALIMAGCSQRAVPFASTSSQPTLQKIAAKPTESLVAHVVFKNDTRGYSKSSSEFTVYWSYAANPFWHVEVQRCVKPGAVFDTKVVYNYIKDGPQIKFGASYPCSIITGNHRAVTFRSMIFDPNAHFHVRYRSEYDFNIERFKFEMCARGGGNNEVCHGDIR